MSITEPLCTFVSWVMSLIWISHPNSFLKYLEKLSNTSGSLFFHAIVHNGKVEGGCLQWISWNARKCKLKNLHWWQFFQKYWEDTESKVCERWDVGSGCDAKVSVIRMAVLEVFLSLLIWIGGSKSPMCKCSKCALLSLLCMGLIRRCLKDTGGA